MVFKTWTNHFIIILMPNCYKLKQAIQMKNMYLLLYLGILSEAWTYPITRRKVLHLKATSERVHRRGWITTTCKETYRLCLCSPLSPITLRQSCLVRKMVISKIKPHTGSYIIFIHKDKDLYICVYILYELNYYAQAVYIRNSPKYCFLLTC